MSVKLSMILVLVFIMVMESGFSAIRGMKTISSHADDALEEEVRNQYDESIRQQVDNAISMLDQYYAAYEAGECTLEEAKKQGADMLRELRYGDSGYFWADDTEGNNIVLLGSDTEGTNRMGTKDGNGYEMVKDIIAVGQQPDGGYCDYVFPKEGGTENLPKRRRNSDKVLFSFARGRERCDRNGHAVFLRPRVDFATTGSEITGISTSSTKLK